MKRISLELIQYQNADKFPEQLESEIVSIYEEIDKGVYKNNKALLERSSHIANIELLFRHRFNLHIEFDKELHRYVPAAIIPFMSDYLMDADGLKEISSSTLGELFGSTNIFKHIRALDKEKQAYLKRIHNRKGFIDLKNARVGGYLADVKNYLITDFFTLKKEGIEARELVAIILHEVGHAFTGLENHHRLTTTNSTIADILDSLNDNQVERAQYIFKKHFNEKDLESSYLGNKNEIVDFYGKLAGVYLKEIRSQFINGKYDQTNFENLADSFASRFNVGKELVSGLEKLHRNHGVTYENTRSVFFTLMLLDVLVSILVLVVLGPFAVVLAGYLFICVYHGNAGHMTYDFPIERYTRIRNNIVNNLKQRDLPDSLMRNLLEQYSFIDEVVNRSMHFKGVLPSIADFFIPTNRENKFHIELQQTIENGLNNSLFISSAAIRVS